MNTFEITSAAFTAIDAGTSGTLKVLETATLVTLYFDSPKGQAYDTNVASIAVSSHDRASRTERTRTIDLLKHIAEIGNQYIEERSK